MNKQMDGVNRRLVLAGGAAIMATPLHAQGNSGTPVVETKYGKLQGFSGPGGVNIYYGIPYGASTGGANRFLPPRPPAPWAGTRDATVNGPAAPQNVSPGGTGLAIFRVPAGVPQSEDCLVLNLWTTGKSATPKPVMVWMHGGGYATGAGSSTFYDGTNLARTGEVVVVAINHRLNIFGYTYLGEHLGDEFATSGNAGQLDQIAALQWVRDNIAAFGGDPSRVMIFGQSGGGGKVSALLAMPGAKGLFSRAAVQSGPGFHMCEKADAVQATDGVLAELGLAKGDARKLQTVEIPRLLAAYKTVSDKLKGLGRGMGGVFGPVVDGVSMPAHPYDPVATPISADVPLLIGYNHTEYTFFKYPKINLEMTEAEMRDDLKPLVAKNFDMRGDLDEVITAYRTAEPKATPWDLCVAIGTDMQMGLLSKEIAHRKNAKGPAHAWLYRLDWETKTFGGHLRAPHNVELGFVFNNLAIGKAFVGDDAPQSLADKMSSVWINFAKTGKPHADGLPDWPAYGPSRPTMIFNTQSRVVNDPDGSERKALSTAMGLKA